MGIVRYLSHPQVHIDAEVPVPEWGLNPIGRKRAERFAEWTALVATKTIVSSGERKALDTAECVARTLGVPVTVRKRMHENDRSATGFLAPERFEQVVDQFFAQPDKSVHGWERAADAQARIVGEMLTVLDEASAGDILCVGHGGVGTLLYCYLADTPISRRHDQPAGGGNVVAFDRTTREILHGWTPIEEFV